MKKYPSIEQTFFMLKPDGVGRGLVGEAFARFEKIGLKLVAARMIRPTEAQAKGNYPGTDEWLIGMGEKTHINYNNNLEEIKNDLSTVDKKEIGIKIYNALVKYLMENPTIITVWEGNHAVKVAQKLVGKTDPTLADVGSIRGDYGFDTPQFAVKAGRIVFKTLVHVSDHPDEAKREIKHWFGDQFKYLGDYTRTDYTDLF